MILSVGLFAVSAAAGIPAKTNGGQWYASKTGTGGNLPADGDAVTILPGTNLTFNATPYSEINPTSRPKVTVNIYGTLYFSGAGNNKLFLDAGSSIQFLGRIHPYLVV